MIDRHSMATSPWIALGRRMGRIAHEVALGLEVLRRVQFDSPWDRRRPH